jgi:hypothetical protein
LKKRPKKGTKEEKITTKKTYIPEKFGHKEYDSLFLSPPILDHDLAWNLRCTDNAKGLSISLSNSSSPNLSKMFKYSHSNDDEDSANWHLPVTMKLNSMESITA